MDDDSDVLLCNWHNGKLIEPPHPKNECSKNAVGSGTTINPVQVLKYAASARQVDYSGQI